MVLGSLGSLMLITGGPSSLTLGGGRGGSLMFRHYSRQVGHPGRSFDWAIKAPCHQRVLIIKVESQILESPSDLTRG